MSVAVVILAAGQGTRMKSGLPKVLHKLAGAPLLEHAMRGAQTIEPDQLVVVAGHGAEQVSQAARAVDPGVGVVVQAEQLGTGHAVREALGALEGVSGTILVLYGDTPFVSPSTLENLLSRIRDGAGVVVLGFETESPGAYGRLVLDQDGGLQEIVEASEASQAQLEIRLCNSGVLAADADLLRDLIRELKPNNAKGELYLTDVVALARARGMTTAAVECDPSETIGVNSRQDLAQAEAAFQNRARQSAMTNGATLRDPESVWFALDTTIGRDVEIGPNVVFGRGVSVEDGAVLRGFCDLEGCRIGPGAQIGPFARLRPGADLAADVRVGNFVEVKNARMEAGSKANHLSYVGDASVGAKANIGAGTICCNYDGVFKHHTDIGANAFIGSNSALVAPVRIGDEAMVSAGSTVTQDVPDGALALARARQENRAGLAKRIMTRLRTLKSKKADS